MRTEVEECIEKLKHLSATTAGPVPLYIIDMLNKAANSLEEQQRKIKKLQKDLEEREILGLQILYKEIGAERDQFLKGLQDIKKHIETIMPNTKEIAVAWRIAEKALTDSTEVKNEKE